MKYIGKSIRQEVTDKVRSNCILHRKIKSNYEVRSIIKDSLLFPVYISTDQTVWNLVAGNNVKLLTNQIKN